jgi:hypothetical protein
VDTTPSTVSEAIPLETPAGFSTSMVYALVPNRYSMLKRGHVVGMHGSRSSLLPRLSKPSIPSNATR